MDNRLFERISQLYPYSNQRVVDQEGTSVIVVQTDSESKPILLRFTMSFGQFNINFQFLLVDFVAGSMQRERELNVAIHNKAR